MGTCGLNNGANMWSQALDGSRCRYHWKSVRHGFDNLVLNSGSDRERSYRNVRFREINSDVRDVSGHFYSADAAHLLDLGGRIATDDQKSSLRNGLLNEWQYVPRKRDHCFLVWEVAHIAGEKNR